MPEQHENLIRLAVFVGSFVVMGLWELASPARSRQQTRLTRWSTNGALVILDSLLLRLLLPLLAIGTAIWAQDAGWGLFNTLALPTWLAVLLAIIALDFLIYAQHVASHHIPILWRFHKVHHTDRDVDITTAVRFHPIEIIFSMGFKMLCVLMLGADPLAVFLFEIILNASAIFNHANVRLPAFLDKVLRLVIVTPDMHSVDHSVRVSETNSNFGFFLSGWDQLFRTYKAEAKGGRKGLVIGLADYQDKRPGSLLFALTLPFRRKT